MAVRCAIQFNSMPASPSPPALSESGPRHPKIGGGGQKERKEGEWAIQIKEGGAGEVQLAEE
jgi:hypothetical protein